MQSPADDPGDFAKRQHRTPDQTSGGAIPPSPAEVPEETAAEVELAEWLNPKAWSVEPQAPYQWRRKGESKVVGKETVRYDFSNPADLKAYNERATRLLAPDTKEVMTREVREFLKAKGNWVVLCDFSVLNFKILVKKKV